MRGVSSRESAEVFIRKWSLTGVLTEYPLDEGIFDWAVSRDYFTAVKPYQTTTDFVAGFTSQRQWHGHYTDGIADGVAPADGAPS